MKYLDRIYGEVEIDEPVILDLINCKSMQRMKGVCQHGHFEPYFPGTTFSRFEHSLGVFILLKKFNAPLFEQIAGLLHDVSHTVFSHVADYVFNDGSGVHQNFQDDELENFIENSEIPKILEKYKINYKDVLDDSKFPLKEKELPDLCADRIDYFLREALTVKKATKKEIGEFLNNFKIINDCWVFKNKDIAKKYAYLFLDINNFFWSGLETGVMFKTMGELIKYCIDKVIITREDLFTIDREVWAKIRPEAEKDPELKFLLNRADNKYVYIEGSEKDYDLHALCKSRVVDPLFLENEKLKRLSETDKKFAELKEKY
ncbi:MAG: HD domain-containing protein, partial [Candidatus Staskawiczbacteria bacterium]|nr:HD domain-containing protein [Candidatus Staskawiczbacteria bacterium]